MTLYFTCFQRSHPPFPPPQSRLHFLLYSHLAPLFSPPFFPFFVAVPQHWRVGEICRFHMLPLVELAGSNVSVFKLFCSRFSLRNMQKQGATWCANTAPLPPPVNVHVGHWQCIGESLIMAAMMAQPAHTALH